MCRLHAERPASLGALASRLRAWAAMRLAVLLLLGVATCACAGGMAPGAPLTDISATNTESTGPFEVIERRTDERGRLRLKVRAARPEAAEEVARRVLYQALPTSSQAVVVEVYDSGEPARRRAVATARSRGGVPASRRR